MQQTQKQSFIGALIVVVWPCYILYTHMAAAVYDSPLLDTDEALNGRYSPRGIDNRSLLIDTILLNTEYETLKYRVDFLRDHMDYFVVIQSNTTFSGVAKPLVLSGEFEAQIRRRLRHRDQLLVYNVNLPAKRTDDRPEDNWNREQTSRGVISSVVRNNLPIRETDLIFVTDLDEIPNPEYLEVLRTMADETLLQDDLYSIHMNMYYYNFGCRASSLWKRSSFSNLRTVLRTGSKYIERAEREKQANLSGDQEFKGVKGWHISYGMSVDSIMNKIRSFSHQELNTPKYNNHNHIEYCIQHCKNWFDPQSKILIKGYIPSELPDNYKKLEQILQL